MQGINNWDFSVFKNFNFTERVKLNLWFLFFSTGRIPTDNMPGRINNVNSRSRANTINYLTPGNSVFGRWDQVYSSNPREMQLGARVTF